MMESEEAIMENENNCNLESESINRDRDIGVVQDRNLNPQDDSFSETNEVGPQPGFGGGAREDNNTATGTITNPEEHVTVSRHENEFELPGEAASGDVESIDQSPGMDSVAGSEGVILPVEGNSIVQADMEDRNHDAAPIIQDDESLEEFTSMEIDGPNIHENETITEPTSGHGEPLEEEDGINSLSDKGSLVEDDADSIAPNIPTQPLTEALDASNSPTSKGETNNGDDVEVADTSGSSALGVNKTKEEDTTSVGGEKYAVGVSGSDETEQTLHKDTNESQIEGNMSALESLSQDNNIDSFKTVKEDEAQNDKDGIWDDATLENNQNNSYQDLSRSDINDKSDTESSRLGSAELQSQPTVVDSVNSSYSETLTANEESSGKVACYPQTVDMESDNYAQAVEMALTTTQETDVNLSEEKISDQNEKNEDITCSQVEKMTDDSQQKDQFTDSSAVESFGAPSESQTLTPSEGAPSESPTLISNEGGPYSQMTCPPQTVYMESESLSQDQEMTAISMQETNDSQPSEKETEEPFSNGRKDCQSGDVIPKSQNFDDNNEGKENTEESMDVENSTLGDGSKEVFETREEETLQKTLKQIDETVVSTENILSENGIIPVESTSPQGKINTAPLQSGTPVTTLGDDAKGNEDQIDSVTGIKTTDNAESMPETVHNSESDNGLDKDTSFSSEVNESSLGKTQPEEDAATKEKSGNTKETETTTESAVVINNTDEAAADSASNLASNVTQSAELIPTTNAADDLSAKTNAASVNQPGEVVEVRNIKKELMDEEDSSKTEAADNSKSQSEMLRSIKKEVGERSIGDAGRENEDDVVVLDDDGESFPVKKEAVLQLEPPTAGPELVISSVSGQEHSLHEQATASAGDASSTSTPTEKGGTSAKKSKAKTQTCIVCLKVCRCKYNIVRNGDIKHLCGDDCFKRFRKTPSAFLRNKEAKTAEAPKTVSTSKSQIPGRDFKSCSVCQLMNVNPNQPFCNWKGLDFCGESCLGKFQANLSTTCSFCRAYIPLDMRATFCLKIGNDMRPFCQQRCYKEFNKNLRLCACCQKDLSSISGAFSAMVGSLDKKIRQFCSQACRQKLEAQIVDVEVVSRKGGVAQNSTSAATPASPSPVPEAACSVCQKLLPIRHTVRYQGKVTRLCSDLCLSAFQYTNKIGMSKCDNCGTVCTAEEAQAHFVQYEGHVKRFCGDTCVNSFRRDNSKIVSCGWCATKKMNFDMIERLDAENKYQMFCSLNCLSLYRVNLQAKSNQAVPCDQCRTVTPAQYHLTMSDASVRNFCSYTCVMTFQSQFTAKHLPPAQPLMPGQVSAPPLKATAAPPKEQPTPPTSKGRGRMSTRQASKQQSPSFPVISNVVSLAPPPDQPNKQPPAPSQWQSVQEIIPPSDRPGALSSGDGKHQIIIQAPPMKVLKNKSLQCRPVTMTKATSCRPHSQPKEVQTDKIPDKQVMVPIPVPIYIPMPTVMYSAPTPIPVPFPIPIPVPVFIPTTRKSAAGIMKTITEIVERMPSDPLEAELLMMAEAVAADKKESDSESEPDADYGAAFEDEPEEPLPAIEKESEATGMKKKDGQGEEDMIQMALRMAEEMSGPIEDLESSVEPVAVNTDPPAQLRSTPAPVYQADEDYVPPGSRGRGRGAKRPGRGRPPTSRAKRMRTERTYAEADDSPQQAMTPQQVIPQQVMEPAADASYRLKFTYGVNAWRHWVIAKNAQIENTRTNNSNRTRTFPTDILKCTTDELNFSLVLFIKEVRKPNGEEYSPDSIYYLCLGIQQYLYENGRIDTIFTDSYFEKFADNLHDILKNLQPKVNSQGQMLCRIEEEHLWESKQLGAHSPFVLLNTLIYFHTKHFILKTAQEHMSLSFAQILKHWKKGVPLKGQASSGKNISLRFYCLANGKKEGLAARKSKEGVPVYEITENFENPLRCPVKLYEFFLSKCPESIKNRNDIFYPVPERSCVPDSPVWYSTQSIGHHTMDKMLTRVLLVREIQEAHLHAQPIYL